jgi:hypothetical protein
MPSRRPPITRTDYPDRRPARGHAAPLMRTGARPLAYASEPGAPRRPDRSKGRRGAVSSSSSECRIRPDEQESRQRRASRDAHINRAPTPTRSRIASARDGYSPARDLRVIDKEGWAAGTVRLPVVGFSQPDADGHERPRVLLLSGDDPYLVDFHPESTIKTRYGTLEALLVDAVADPIPAGPGWVAELWIGLVGNDAPEFLGVYPVLAWEPDR